jgi:hypothetical protein
MERGRGEPDDVEAEEEGMGVKGGCGAAFEERDCRMDSAQPEMPFLGFFETFLDVGTSSGAVVSLWPLDRFSFFFLMEGEIADRLVGSLARAIEDCERLLGEAQECFFPCRATL